MTPAEVELVDHHLRFTDSTRPGWDTLVAWEEERAVGHLHRRLASRSARGPERLRGRGAPTARDRGDRLSEAAEELVRERGFDRIALDVDVDAPGPRALVRAARVPPERDAAAPAKGTILLRGEPFSYDAVLLDLVKSPPR